ncbi:MAG: hypothetical protein WCO44_02820 [Bacteroidota bacterium]
MTSAFNLIKSKGIHSLADLLKELKTKPKIEKFAKDTALSVEYLTMLRREANSNFSAPLRLTKTNSEKGLTNARFTAKDMEYCKELGRDLPFNLNLTQIQR